MTPDIVGEQPADVRGDDPNIRQMIQDGGSLSLSNSPSSI